ncbi:MAG: hypothetical protein DWQ06_13770 [Calditrichaeota bacterium]|nr:MAG: hypothetical protein DWQ06_13770 [Calditrichota bacterium]
MNCSQANNFPIQEIVENFLNLEQRKRRGSELWYCSPFRNEKTPSFKINLETNMWYDFGKTSGMLSGGKVVDLLLELKLGTISQILKILESNYESKTKSNHSLFSFPKQKNSQSAKNILEQKQFKIIRIKPLKNEALIEFIESRKVKIEIAKKYLEEIYFKNLKNEKTYFALGFRNNSKDYEWKNKYLSGVFGKKDFTAFFQSEERTEINVFEGFFDFLAHLSYQDQNLPKTDSLVLNSVSLTKRAILFLEKHNYKQVNLFLDNDKAGEEATQRFMALENILVFDRRELYKTHKDFNDFLISLS